MMSYNEIRQQYKPESVQVLLIAESPPSSPASGGSRHFYRTDMKRPEDRLFINTVRALYPETVGIPQQELERQKEQWLRRFQADGWYMIEALETSLKHEVTKKERQSLIRQHLPELIERVRKLANDKTRIILIKSNVFDVAASPLRDAGFVVINTELLDYPGRFNQQAYREKLAVMSMKIRDAA
jgi:hypothetical protein